MKSIETPILWRFHSWIKAVSEYPYTLYILLSIGFLLRLLLFLNTTQFEDVSEVNAVWDAIEMLRTGEHVYLYTGNYPLGIAYVAYFFEYTFGSLDWFFIFQCFVATATLYFVYIITLKISGSKTGAVISLLLATIYMDFAMLPPVIYNQNFEIFFTAAAMLISIHLFDSKNLAQLFAWTLFLFATLYVSLLLKATLQYYYFIFLFLFGFSVLRKWRRSGRLKFEYLLAFLVGFLIFNYLVPRNFFTKPGAELTNGHVFFGHTDYGGLGGEGAFLYEENELRCQKALDAYLIENDIDEPTRKQLNAFQKAEMIKFIKQKPLSWVGLQIRKVVYTYGSVPVRDTLTLLKTGKLNIGLILSVLLAQLTFALPILLFFLFMRWAKFRELLTNRQGQLLLFVFLYTLTATSIYGHYQERYRILVMVPAIIPLIGIFYDPHYLQKIFSNRSLLLTKLAIFSLIFLIWAYQVYEALWVNNDRYFKYIENVSSAG
jgi:hypothetical protein